MLNFLETKNHHTMCHNIVSDDEADICYGAVTIYESNVHQRPMLGKNEMALGMKSSIVKSSKQDKDGKSTKEKGNYVSSESEDNSPSDKSSLNDDGDEVDDEDTSGDDSSSDDGKDDDDFDYTKFPLNVRVSRDIDSLYYVSHCVDSLFGMFPKTASVQLWYPLSRTEKSSKSRFCVRTSNIDERSSIRHQKREVVNLESYPNFRLSEITHSSITFQIRMYWINPNRAVHNEGFFQEWEMQLLIVVLNMAKKKVEESSDETKRTIRNNCRLLPQFDKYPEKKVGNINRVTKKTTIEVGHALLTSFYDVLKDLAKGDTAHIYEPFLSGLHGKGIKASELDVQLFAQSLVVSTTFTCEAVGLKQNKEFVTEDHMIWGKEYFERYVAISRDTPLMNYTPEQLFEMWVKEASKKAWNCIKSFVPEYDVDMVHVFYDVGWNFYAADEDISLTVDVKKSRKFIKDFLLKNLKKCKIGDLSSSVETSDDEEMSQDNVTKVSNVASALEVNSSQSDVEEEKKLESQNSIKSELMERNHEMVSSDRLGKIVFLKDCTSDEDDDDDDDDDDNDLVRIRGGGGGKRKLRRVENSNRGRRNRQVTRRYDPLNPPEGMNAAGGDYRRHRIHNDNAYASSSVSEESGNESEEESSLGNQTLMRSPSSQDHQTWRSRCSRRVTPDSQEDLRGGERNVSHRKQNEEYSVPLSDRENESIRSKKVYEEDLSDNSSFREGGNEDDSESSIEPSIDDDSLYAADRSVSSEDVEDSFLDMSTSEEEDFMEDEVSVDDDVAGDDDDEYVEHEEGSNVTDDAHVNGDIDYHIGFIRKRVSTYDKWLSYVFGNSHSGKILMNTTNVNENNDDDENHILDRKKLKLKGLGSLDYGAQMYMPDTRYIGKSEHVKDLNQLDGLVLYVVSALSDPLFSLVNPTKAHDKVKECLIMFEKFQHVREEMMGTRNMSVRLETFSYFNPMEEFEADPASVFCPPRLAKMEKMLHFHDHKTFANRYSDIVLEAMRTLERVFDTINPNYELLSPQCKTKIVYCAEVVAREFGSSPHVGILAHLFKKENDGSGYFVPPQSRVQSLTNDDKKYTGLSEGITASSLPVPKFETMSSLSLYRGGMKRSRHFTGNGGSIRIPRTSLKDALDMRRNDHGRGKKQLAWTLMDMKSSMKGFVSKYVKGENMIHCAEDDTSWLIIYMTALTNLEIFVSFIILSDGNLLVCQKKGAVVEDNMEITDEPIASSDNSKEDEIQGEFDLLEYESLSGMKEDLHNQFINGLSKLLCDCYRIEWFLRLSTGSRSLVEKGDSINCSIDDFPSTVNGFTAEIKNESIQVVGKDIVQTIGKSNLFESSVFD